jgi:hypothetical protein
MGTAVWWLGLAIAISMGTVYAVPYPFGLVAIVVTFVVIGYIIPMRIIENHSAKIHASSKVANRKSLCVNIIK